MDGMGVLRLCGLTWKELDSFQVDECSRFAVEQTAKSGLSLVFRIRCEKIQ